MFQIYQIFIFFLSLILFYVLDDAPTDFNILSVHVTTVVDVGVDQVSLWLLDEVGKWQRAIIPIQNDTHAAKVAMPAACSSFLVNS